MVVFSNQRIGAAAELLVSSEVAAEMLRATAEAARSSAEARWELELVRWLEEHAQPVAGPGTVIDVADIAWTPEHFEHQRGFLIDAVQRATRHCEHARALTLWSRMIEAHPRDSVQVGRRWQWLFAEATG
jgi:hypothetical protein